MVGAKAADEATRQAKRRAITDFIFSKVSYRYSSGDYDGGLYFLIIQATARKKRGLADEGVSLAETTSRITKKDFLQ